MRLLAALIVALVLSLTGGAAQSRQTSAVGTFREKTVAYKTEGTFAGATEVWHTVIYLLHSQKRAGAGLYACIHVTKRDRLCIGTLILPLGRVKLIGQVSNRAFFQLALVGGTGFYEGAAGVAIFEPGLITFYIV